MRGHTLSDSIHPTLQRDCWSLDLLRSYLNVLLHGRAVQLEMSWV